LVCCFTDLGDYIELLAAKSQELFLYFFHRAVCDR
jgi:hypothetical protein